MPLFEQKYSNVSRTVEGTVFVEQDDSILVVTTASQAGNIKLLTIPENKWSTQYKLYVVDGSNNAATNNITITAPSGFTINGASTIVISTNGGTALVRVVSNTAYIGTLGAPTTSTASLPYLYSRKDMFNSAIAYVPQAASPTNSVFSGTPIATYTTSTNNNISGFDSSTGVWTVATAGYYAVSAKMVTRINETNINATTDGTGASWMTLSPGEGGLGYIGIGIQNIVLVSGQSLNISSAKQLITQQISDVTIECSQVIMPFAVGDRVKVFVLNKTNHDIVGIPQSGAGLTDCYIDFSVTKVA